MGSVNDEQAAAADVAVVMVPLPAQGHLNQLLHLSRLISVPGVSIHYTGTTMHNRQARDRVFGGSPSVASIQFHDLPVRHFATPPPNPDATDNFPGHLQPLFDATFDMEEPLTNLVRCLATTARRVVIIHDSSMAFITRVAAAAASKTEIFAFNCVSAFASLSYMREAQGKCLEVVTMDGECLPSLSFEDCFTEQFKDYLRRQQHLRGEVSGHLVNTCRAIEGQFFDLLTDEPAWHGRKNYAIGPLNPVAVPTDGCSDTRGRHKCLEWLDQQPHASVLYVSFGTMTSLPGEQVAQLAAGLAESGQRFIWVFRHADRGDIYSAADGTEGPYLPRGYEDILRGRGRGLVVRGWAPQLEILGHSATGGFMSHCGWNSCMESMSMRVPMLTWPMHSDQPRNSLLVTMILKIGIAVREWSQRHQVILAESIKDKIILLMEGDEGKEMRKRARAVGDATEQAMSDGGTSSSDLKSFVAHITRPT